MSKRTLATVLSLSLIYFLMHACHGSEQKIKKAQFITNGYQVYKNHCQNCHGAKGEGLGTLYPPLTDQSFLEKQRDELPTIVAFGMSGEIKIHGISYDTKMPPNPQLSPIEIAYVLTYITNSFGNEADIYTLEKVNKQLKAH